LVRYIVRSVHVLLQSKLGLPGGLADPGVRLLDPAAGTMNFLRAAWREVIDSHAPLGAHGVARCTGIELLGDIEARGRVTLRRFLKVIGCGGAAGWLSTVHADALAPPPELLAEPFNVVIGNPPWRGRSSNRGDWITQLLHGYRLPDGRQDEGYFRVDGGPLGERNPKWLHDDYVKFLRLAQYSIDRNGEGIAGLVLNHNFLDAPTFRGLRRSLLGTFQEIYALDLHGNRRRGEGDENVFPGVAQGAAVLLLVKKPGLLPRLLRADLHGSRRDKLWALHRGDARTTRWTEIEPRAPVYLFVAGDRAIEREYQQGIPLAEIFPVHGPGIITGRDAVVTALDRATLERRIAGLFDHPAGLSGRQAEALRRDAGWRGKITRCLVRPFDLRYLFYAGYLVERPRKSVMEPMRGGDNVGLIVSRQSKEEPGALVTRWITGHKVVSACDVSSLFPLYLGVGAERRPNLSPALTDRLGDLYGHQPPPETILGYIYSLMYSDTWRRRYRELLRQDFPRISFPRDPRHFGALAGLGRELIELHLLRAPRLQRPPDPLDPAVRNFRIGAYPVLAQWVRARRGRDLRREEVHDVQRIAEALRLTLEVQTRIEEEMGDRWRPSGASLH